MVRYAPPEDGIADATGGLRRRVRVHAPAPAPVLSAEPAAAPPLRVGLLGGSFNPAHDGHRYISIEALTRLGLDQVWWLVSPQNPLKPRAGMAPFARRLAVAEEVARHPRIKVVDHEARFGTSFTAETLARYRTWRDHRFVWLIGADNLRQMPQWRHWTMIFERCVIAVFERSPYSYGALAGLASRRFARWRVPESRARSLVSMDPPAWLFLRMQPHPASSTMIRRARRWDDGTGPQEQEIKDHIDR